MSRPSLQDYLMQRQVLICVGSGGVGKTTTAAALALQAAMMGRKALVLTIDPARRLANALGLSSLSNGPQQVPLEGVAPGGELWAVMLDTQATFDELISKLAPDQQSRDEILENPIYRIVSDSFAGSQEYMATEKLYDLHVSGEFDLVVLDTPPVKNALDFLDAPGRLARFLDRRIVKWFLAPYDENKVFGRVLVGTSGVVFRLLGVLFGREFLRELSIFFQAFRDLYDGFRERHQAVEAIFDDDGTSFVVVAAPTESALDVAAFFRDELTSRKLLLDAFVLNRVHRAVPEPGSELDRLRPLMEELAAELAPGTVDSLLAHMKEARARLERVVEEEAPYRERARALARATATMKEIPLLQEPVRDLSGLHRMAHHLFGVRHGS